jgi:hypothetical protein
VLGVEVRSDLRYCPLAHLRKGPVGAGLRVTASNGGGFNRWTQRS